MKVYTYDELSIGAQLEALAKEFMIWEAAYEMGDIEVNPHEATTVADLEDYIRCSGIRYDEAGHEVDDVDIEKAELRELATTLDRIAEDVDPFSYQDGVEDREENIEGIMSILQEKDTEAFRELREWYEDAIDYYEENTWQRKMLEDALKMF